MFLLEKGLDMMETKLSDLEGLKKKEMDYLMDYTMSGGGVSEI